MHILFTRFPLESSYGGAEMHTLTLMQELMERGHTVAFAGSCPTLLRLCTEHDIPATKFEIGPPPVTKWGAISFAWRKQRMQHLLQAMLENFKDLDAVFMLSLSEKLLLTELAHKKHLKTFWIEHDTVGPWLERNPWKKHLLEQSKKALTITVSDLSRHLYEKLGWNTRNLIAIPNGIPESEEVEPPEDEPIRIGCIARLSPEKGVDVLIRAMEDVKDARLDIVGRGRQSEHLYNVARHAKILNSVRFLDPMDDINPFYDTLHILVLPSRIHDPFGIVAAEAMMRGIPTVITDACGIADYVEDKQDCLIVPAGNVHALQDALKKLVRDKTLRESLRIQGHKTAKQKFTVKRMTDDYEKILEK